MSSYEQTRIADSTKQLINPATNEELISAKEALEAIIGMRIPPHDSMVVDETNQALITITYSLGLNVVAVKTVAIVGAVTTVTVA